MREKSIKRDEVETMGYILPVRQFQSEQYANRLSMRPYNFARIGRVQQVKLKSDFQKEYEERLHFHVENKDKRKDQKPFVAVYPPRLSKGYVQPNQVNLSPAISEIVGKGISVNTYI